MVEFQLTWLSEGGSVCTGTGRASMEQINDLAATTRPRTGDRVLPTA